MAKDTHGINLLPSQENGLLVQFLDWALGIGRTLVILTEIVALGTFLYRFSLDRQIIDLHDQIKSESLIITSFKNFEDTARNLQARLTLIKQYDSLSTVTPTIFSDIIAMGKDQITFHSILVATDSIKIEAQASSADILNGFVTKVRSYPAVASVTIDKVQNKTSDATITVVIIATLKTAKPSLPPGATNATDQTQPATQ
jgi:Tfp pilus assembly protein PilN